VNTQAAGGNIACVMQHDYRYLTEWSDRGLLLPLNDLMDSGAIDVSNVSQSVIDSGSVDGNIVGISLGTNSQAFILDADAFEANGIELPPFDWTFDDFESISLQFAEQGIWGLAYGIWDDSNLKAVLLSTGQDLYNAEGTAMGITDPAPLLDYMNRIYAMMEAGAIPTMDLQADISAPGLEGSPIIDGREAMNYLWSNQVIALTTAAGEDRNFVLYPLPRYGDVSPNYLKPSMFFSITSECANVEEAALFIDFVTNNLEANDILFAERGVPVDADVLAYLSEKVDPVTADVFQYIADVTEIAIPVPPPDPAGASDVITNVLAPLFVDPILFGMTSAEDAFPTFEEEANLILAQNAE
jgi:multiple sugar transport system substrate-binding protein